MIDTFSLLLSHGLLLAMFWRLLARPDLDDDDAPSTPLPPPPIATPTMAPPAQERAGDA